MDNRVIQTFWQGPMSLIQQLSMRSYVNAGHCVHLYMYAQPETVPDGVIVKDAAEILPADRNFTYRKGPGKGSVSAFSDLFRFSLLYQRGGWWSDLDVVCLKPYDFSDEFVFCAQRHQKRRWVVFKRKLDAYTACCIIKCPRGSEIMRYCVEQVQTADLDRVRWGEIGPDLLHAAVVHRFGLSALVKPYMVFNPVDWFDTAALFKATPLPETAYAVHLFEDMWRRRGIDPGAVFAPDSLYEALKRRLL